MKFCKKKCKILLFVCKFFSLYLCNLGNYRCIFHSQKLSYLAQEQVVLFPECLCVVKLCKCPNTWGANSSTPWNRTVEHPPIPHWQLQIIFGRAAEFSALILDSFIAAMINPLRVLREMGERAERAPKPREKEVKFRLYLTINQHIPAHRLLQVPLPRWKRENRDCSGLGFISEWELKSCLNWQNRGIKVFF